jgi:ABC-type nitrate/sulfonate/bicarbonate transport system substrate-binding protein
MNKQWYRPLPVLSPRPLAGEGEGEGSEKRPANISLIAGSLFLIFVWLTTNLSLAQAQELRRILYGVSTSISHLPVWVGNDAGLFAKNGLNIEPVQIRGGAVSTMAIMSGQSVLSGVGAGSVVAARVEGGDIVLLACPADLEPVYLIARPEIKSAAELKGKAAGVTRLNSSIHFYLRNAARMVGVDSDKEMTLLQLGGSAEITAALEAGRIAAAALTIKDVLPFIQRGWPVLVDLSKSDLVYPSSCVTSTRAFVKSDPKTVNAFLNAYVSAIGLIKKDQKLAERSLIKWVKERESATLTKALEAFTRLFKPVPYVPDKGIENILRDLARQRPVPKELIGHPELFRDNGPLERALPKS